MHFFGLAERKESTEPPKKDSGKSATPAYLSQAPATLGVSCTKIAESSRALATTLTCATQSDSTRRIIVDSFCDC